MKTCFKCNQEAKQLTGNQMNDLILNVISWGAAKGIFDSSNHKSQLLKTMAELGELADDVNKGNDIKLELGDVLVTLILLAELSGVTIEESLQSAYDKISKRKGKMINGIFVKEEDL